MGLARPGLIYCNKQTNLTYRWKGTAGWQQVGGSPNQPGVSVVNGLDVGGTEVSLSAEMGKLLKQNINAVQANIVRLYNKLGNIAFWSTEDKAAAAPTALDWNTPKITVTLNKAGLSDNALIADANDTEITGTTISVDQGGSLTLKIKPRPGHNITTASASIGGTVQTLVENDGVYTLVFQNVQSPFTVTISCSTEESEVPVQSYSLTVSTMNCSTVGSVPQSIEAGTSVNIQFAGNEGYELNAESFIVENASMSFNATTGVLTISNPEDDVTITAEAHEVAPQEYNLKFLKGYHIEQSTGLIKSDQIMVDEINKTERILLSDFLRVTYPEGVDITQETVVNDSASSKIKISYGDKLLNTMAAVALYRKVTNQNYAYEYLGSIACHGSRSYRDSLGNKINELNRINDINAALQAGALYIRFVAVLAQATDSALPDQTGSLRSMMWNNASTTNNYLFNSLYSSDVHKHTIVSDLSLFALDDVNYNNQNGNNE